MYKKANSRILVNKQDTDLKIKICSFDTKAHLCKNFHQGWEFALWFFEGSASFLWGNERNSKSLFSKSESLLSLFFKEQWEQFVPGHSFLKSEESDSLLLLFKKSNRAKSDRSDSFLGIKEDKNGKSSEEQGVFESKCAICSKKNKQITLLFFKSDREWITLVALS